MRLQNVLKSEREGEQIESRTEVGPDFLPECLHHFESHFQGRKTQEGSRGE